MAYELEKLNLPITADDLGQMIDDLLNSQGPRFRRLWMYYRNPMLPRTADRDEQGSDRPYRQAQEWGLPSRVTGMRCSTDPLSGQTVGGVARKEVVIENDIAWRIDAMIDFLFGKPITIRSLAIDPSQKLQIESLLQQIFDTNGGAGLLQQLALLGSVYGFVDVLVKFDASAVPATDGDAPSSGNGAPSADSLPPPAESAPQAESTVPDSVSAFLPRMARTIRFEVVGPARALPVLSQTDWRQVTAYAQVYQVRQKPGESRSTAKSNWMSRLFPKKNSADEPATIVELLTSTTWQRYENENLVASGSNSLGEIPLVHIQNLAVPFQYAGSSDVEQLSPLQDELNTRLSDRANRITMQSFKMYLGKGIDGFTDLPVAPGRMWVTDNDNADVIEFGGDPSSPSEDQHIAELREAMDKISSVTPVAAGVVRDKLGNLTSAVALQVTMMAMLAKTDRKRATYGCAIKRMCELALAWLDLAGIFHTTPDQRQVTIDWPDILPKV